jgi:CheY-like chemotaxis protein
MIEEKIICFEVRDTGIGIEEKHLHRLFERFSQVDSSTKREYGGTGLGLAICKGLVEKMKGCISVTSNKDEGSVFLFKLPLKEAPIIISSNNPQASVPEDAVKAEMRFQTAGSSVALPRLSAESKMSFDPEHPPSFPTCKVLLVDDNDINRKVLNKMLAKFTCSVTDAVNGSNAVELYTSNPSAFNVVLMDLHMPGLDGYEATHAIREWEKKEKRAPVYITALTADVISGTDEKCIKAGMNDFVSKPVSMAELARILRNAEKSMVVTVMDEKDKSSKTV